VQNKFTAFIQFLLITVVFTSCCKKEYDDIPTSYLDFTPYSGGEVLIFQNDSAKRDFDTLTLYEKKVEEQFVSESSNQGTSHCGHIYYTHTWYGFESSDKFSHPRGQKDLAISFKINGWEGPKVMVFGNASYDYRLNLEEVKSDTITYQFDMVG